MQYNFGNVTYKALQIAKKFAHSKITLYTKILISTGRKVDSTAIQV